ncbi:MAG: bifunctional oligoribonuclease/PAP phosphatase NrnA, partial [Lachnospirales bacterium]
VKIDKFMASAIYTGILLDTGGFMHNSTSKRTHQIAGELVECGVDTPFIHSKMLKEHTIPQIKVFNKALSNIKIDGKVAYTYLTNEEMAQCNATSSDLDGIVEYILNIKGVCVSLLATERGEDLVKLSFRSKSVDVNEVASLFGGGGHILAAGAAVKNGKLSDVVNRAVEILKDRITKNEK